MVHKEEGKKLKPGERGFSIFLLVAGLFMLYESVKMFLKDPKLISHGGFPLILSVLLVIFAGYIIFNDRNSKIEGSNQNKKKKILNVKDYLFPSTVTALMFFMIFYCIALYINLGFELSTTVFLIVSFCFFRRNQHMKNILYTFFTMASILLIFKYGFSILLP